MPVIKHLDGNCHVYVDAAADLEMALAIVDNAKTQKVSPCNAAESLLVHAAIAAAFLPRIGAVFADKGVEMRVDARAPPLLNGVAGAEVVAATRGRLERGVPLADHQRQGRRRLRRRDRAHQPLRLAPHRRDRHDRTRTRCASCARSTRPA